MYSCQKLTVDYIHIVFGILLKNNVTATSDSSSRKVDQALLCHENILDELDNDEPHHIIYQLAIALHLSIDLDDITILSLSPFAQGTTTHFLHLNFYFYLSLLPLQR